MLQPLMREPDWITQLPDGTVKQLNPFTGTEVWTVAGRGNRPLGVHLPDPVPLDPAQHGRHCAFCEHRYFDTPPEKSRVIRHEDGNWETRYRVAAEDLLCSGRSIDAARALAIGLVHALADDPAAAALAYFDEHLAAHSGAALAHALQAARAPRVAALREDLARVERLYLQSLMSTHDANEGLAAFLAKRTPHWEHR